MNFQLYVACSILGVCLLRQWLGHRKYVQCAVIGLFVSQLISIANAVMHWYSGARIVTASLPTSAIVVATDLDYIFLVAMVLSTSEVFDIMAMIMIMTGCPMITVLASIDVLFSSEARTGTSTKRNLHIVWSLAGVMVTLWLPWLMEIYTNRGGSSLSDVYVLFQPEVGTFNMFQERAFMTIFVDALVFVGMIWAYPINIFIRLGVIVISIFSVSLGYALTLTMMHNATAASIVDAGTDVFAPTPYPEARRPIRLGRKAE